jgi:hypothetical protein
MNYYNFYKNLTFLKISMKSLLLTSAIALLNTKFNFLPTAYLIMGIFFLVCLDFITGVAKSKIQGKDRVSKRYRETISKGIQYSGGIVLAMFIFVVSRLVPELQQLSFFSLYASNTILTFITLIELKSNFENLIAIDSTSLLSKYCFIPLNNILGFEFKNLFKLPQEIEESNSNIKL